MKRRTGIYGGTFNPIHQGHVQLGETLLAEGLLDELWYMVSPQNPFKMGHHLLADEARLALARLAVRENDSLHVSDFEFHLPRPSYMIHTLDHLSEVWPDREFLLVIGADNWKRFPGWYRHEEILSRYRIILFPRPGYPITESLPEGVRMARTPLIDLCSTNLRRRISGDCLYAGEGLPPAVWKEIKEKKYYISNDE